MVAPRLELEMNTPFDRYARVHRAISSSCTVVSPAELPCFHRFSSSSLPLAGTMSFLIAAIAGWPPQSEYHMVECQINSVRPLYNLTKIVGRPFHKLTKIVTSGDFYSFIEKSYG